MSSLLYLYDGSFEGLLSAVALAVKSGRSVPGIYPEGRYAVQLFDTIVNVSTDTEQARKLFSYLENIGGSAAQFAINGYLGEEDAVGQYLYHMVRLCLQHGGRATELYTDDSIRFLSQLSRRVTWEAHRLCGLIRFRELKENIFYAPFESDCNVIGYLVRHFSARMGNRRWILHDISRNFALYRDGDHVQNIAVDESFSRYVQENGEVADEYCADKEQYYQKLWQMFHATIANPGRENRHLQRQLMPRRYWRYLVEMNK